MTLKKIIICTLFTSLIFTRVSFAGTIVGANDTTLTIQGQIESVLENSKHGLSVRFEGLETYIHIDSNTTIRKVEN